MVKILRRSANVTYNIELSAAEAAALYTVLMHVGGLPEGPRGLIDKIGSQLNMQINEDYCASETYECSSGSVMLHASPEAQEAFEKLVERFS